MSAAHARRVYGIEYRRVSRPGREGIHQRFDSDTRLIASSIYDWFQEDFGGDEAGVIAHLRLYAHPELKGKLEGITGVYDFDYDWTLNDADWTLNDAAAVK
jgi:hypothetical protein